MKFVFSPFFYFAKNHYDLELFMTDLKRTIPSLIRLINNNPELVDRYSISRVLTTDLYGAKYSPELQEEVEMIDSSNDDNFQLVKDRRRKRKPISSVVQSTLHISPKKTLQELHDGDSDLDDTEIAQGFVNDEGEDFYIIEKVIRYHPERGYFVHWKGYPKSERTWQHPEDMPPGLEEEMKHARDQYHKQKLFA